MIPYSRILGLLFLLFVYLVKGDPCVLKQVLPKTDVCNAEMECQHYIDFNVKSGQWECIQHISYHNNYDYYYNNRQRQVVTYDSTYSLKIKVVEPNGVEQLLRVNEENNIVELILQDGSLQSIPEEIYKMARLENIDMSGNQISTVKFYKFLPLLRLNEINLSNNLISVIEHDEQISTSFDNHNIVKAIDISYNSIEEIPNKFLTKFNQLKHLNLSHNMISTIGILTFDGIGQLQILDISYNKLLEVGNAFARFVNLQNLEISNNYITKLIDFNFVTLTNLVKLNASSNAITEIENSTLQSMTNLEYLDLSYNKIGIISNRLFSSNINLFSLALLNNSIELIEENSFINNKIQAFSIQNNKLKGTLKKETFKGLNVNELNLSGGYLTSINDDAFTGVSELEILNISSNELKNISSNAFSSLTSLNILDLSQNLLKELSFQSADLKNVSKLFTHHNNVKKITENVFKNFDSLTELDLSYNDLQVLEPRSFLNLNNLELIRLTGSNFVNILEQKALEGLTNVVKIDLSGTKTTCFKNESFSGLVALNEIYSVFGQLSNIEYNAFLGTGSLEKLTLSNNQLQHFHINTSTILQIQEINLYNNFIKNLSNKTFSRLNLLRNLNLANNDLIKIVPDVFLDLNNLVHLNLSLNEKMTIIGNPFENLSKLNTVSLQNVKTKISFENSSATIETVHLQSCAITDINKVNIFNVHDLVYLYLSSNEIGSIDKDSFRHMPSLVFLDLSFNKIIYIQPGSFLHVNDLETLDLSRNNLPSIQFGVFDGLNVLKQLNLSSNVLASIEIKLLPAVSQLCLDDNIITDLDFQNLFRTEIRELSIGGNQLSCKVLADLKSSNYSEIFTRTVTAGTFDYHSENVDGISCRNFHNSVSSIVPVSVNSSYDISSFISSLRNYLDKFGKSVETIANQYTKKTENFNDDTINAAKTLENFINRTYLNQIASNGFFTKLTDINNNSNIQLEEIKKYLMNLTVYLQEFPPTSKSESNSKNISNDLSTLHSEFEKMLKQENDALREEFKIALASISTGIPSQQFLVSRESPNKDSGESRVLFYFIAICLAILVVAYISKIVFSYITKSRRPRTDRNLSRATTFSNSIELG